MDKAINMKYTSYEQFLMAELALVYGIIDSDKPYDIIWGEAKELIDEFQDSNFNDEDQPQYQCIEKFLQNKKDVNNDSLNVLSFVNSTVDEKEAEDQRKKDERNRKIKILMPYVEKYGKYLVEFNNSYLAIHAGNRYGKIRPLCIKAEKCDLDSELKSFTHDCHFTDYYSGMIEWHSFSADMVDMPKALIQLSENGNIIFKIKREKSEETFESVEAMFKNLATLFINRNPQIK